MVYFVQHTDFIKIGHTNEIRKRISELQVNCPVKLKVLGLIKGGAKEEKYYHKEFIEYSSHGEWFRYAPELVEFIDCLDKQLMWDYGFVPQDRRLMGVIKECRVLANMSLSDVSELVGITKQSLNEFELSEIQGRITINSIRKVLSAMGYEFQYRAVKLPK